MFAKSGLIDFVSTKSYLPSEWFHIRVNQKEAVDDASVGGSGHENFGDEMSREEKED